MSVLRDAFCRHHICTEDGIQIITSATVPIIKLTERTIKVKVDMSFNMNYGPQSAQLVLVSFKEEEKKATDSNCVSDDHKNCCCCCFFFFFLREQGKVVYHSFLHIHLFCSIYRTKKNNNNNNNNNNNRSICLNLRIFFSFLAIFKRISIFKISCLCIKTIYPSIES